MSTPSPHQRSGAAFLVIGCAFLPIGIATHLPALWIIGLVFMLAGTARSMRAPKP